MNTVFESGRIIDLILLFVLLELIVLMGWTRLRGAMSRVDVISLVAPGVMLMLVIRNVMTSGPHTMTAALLAAALVFHLWDVSRRRGAGNKS